nr:hypothetical protein [Tanacetum cinerariifolium]
CSKRNSKTHEESQYSKSNTPTTREELTRRRRHRHSHSLQPTSSVFLRLKRDRSVSPRRKPKERKEGGVFERLGGREKSVSAHFESRYPSHRLRGKEVFPKKCHHKETSSRITERLSKSKDSEGGHWKLRLKSQRQLQRRNDGRFQRGVICLILHSPKMRECGLMTFPQNVLIVIDEQDRLAEEKAQLIKDENLTWDNVQAIMDADYELAASANTRKQFKRAGDKLDQGRSKKQKVEVDKEQEELKRCLEIIPYDRDDVTIDATPLSIKTPIIDYKIYK